MSAILSVPIVRGKAALRQVRMARGLSQRDLERAAGLAPTSVSHFEAGRRSPDPAQLWRLADVLDVDVDLLLN